MKNSAKPKRGGGRPIGPLQKKIKHFDRQSPSKRIETDADQLRIKLEIDTKYAGAPDMGRVIPKGTPEFERIASELLARENKGSGVVDMGTKGKVCDVTGCSSPDWKGGKCWKHHPENVAKREAKEAEKAAAVPPPVAEPVVDLPAGFGMVVNGAGDPVQFGVDPVILMALREALQAKEAGWLVELSGMKPGKAVCSAASMVKAIEGLGY